MAHNLVLSTSYYAELVYDNVSVTSNLAGTITTRLHHEVFKAKIIKDTDRTTLHFATVNWEAHEAALLATNRFLRISICKLVHGLVHTNQQSQWYHGTSSLCPYCGTSEETFDHKLICQSLSSITFREEALLTLQKKLDHQSTPPAVLSAVIYGISSFHHQPNTRIRHPSQGSVLPENMLLAQCLHHQSELGWSNFLRGRISKKWRLLFEYPTKGK